MPLDGRPLWPPCRSIEVRLRLPGVDLWTTHKPLVAEVWLMFMLLGAGGVGGVTGAGERPTSSAHACVVGRGVSCRTRVVKASACGGLQLLDGLLLIRGVLDADGGCRRVCL